MNDIGTPVGTVSTIYRFPVKSLGGESLFRVDATAVGVVGDRAFGVIDTDSGRLLSAKTVPQLLDASAVFNAGAVSIATADAPEISSAAVDIETWLSEWLGRSVRLARPQPETAADIDIDVSDDLASDDAPDQRFTFRSRPGLFFDGQPYHFLTTASLERMRLAHPGGDWRAERFRPNVVIETPATGFTEDDWVGHRLTIGGATFVVTKRCDRCILTTRALGGGAADREILRTLHRVHGGDLGVKGTLEHAGSIAVGDRVTLHPS